MLETILEFLFVYYAMFQDHCIYMVDMLAHIIKSN
jgi:hypothetical protein